MRISDLENYRDSNGFIVLDTIYSFLPKKIELAGKREKEWLVFEDGMVLIKFTHPNTYEAYAELLGQESYKFFNIPAAKCDLMKLGAKEGILSVDVRKPKEFMLSGKGIMESYSTIIKENNGGHDPITVTPHFNTLMDIEQALQYSSARYYTTSIMTSLDWVFAVACIILDIDKHLSNWSIILSGNSGECRLSPQYDMSATGRFMITKKRIATFLKNFNHTTKKDYRVRLITNDIFGSDYDRSATLRYDRGNDSVIGINSLIYALKKDPERFWEIAEKMMEFAPEKIVDKVEQKIKTKIPDECKQWFIAVCSTNIDILKRFLEEYTRENGVKGK